VIGHSILHLGAAGAINLTASHNPPTDLGFKVRDAAGAALAPPALETLAAHLPPIGEEVLRLDFASAEREGRIRRVDPAPPYRAYVAERVDLDALARAGLRVAYDPMWGAGIGWLGWLLGPGAATQFLTIHDEPNPGFPEMRQPEPIPPNTDALGRHVRRTSADIGIANDGDADRIGVYDEHGAFVNQLQVYALLAWHLLENRGERGAIVKTVSTTSMLEILGKKYGVDVFETGVGFKYVAPKMLATNALIGGEESGGFAFRGLPERDGLMAALYLLDLIHHTGRTPSELITQLYEAVGGEWHYGRRDVQFAAEDRSEIEARLSAAAPTTLAGRRVATASSTDGYRYLLEDGGWLLIRFSGTEALMRIYAETPGTSDAVQPLLAAGIALAGVSS
jgi:phosphomannomutase